MRMKISLALGKTRSLSRETALSCLTANLAMPGTGSLAAGRRSGYIELLLSFIGVVLTLVFGTRFLIWFAKNWGWELSYLLKQSQNLPVPQKG